MTTAGSGADSELMTKQEVKSEPTLWRLKQAGLLVPIYLGSAVRYRRKDVLAFLDKVQAAGGAIAVAGKAGPKVVEGGTGGRGRRREKGTRA